MADDRRFALLVEGESEHRALGTFLRRWLDAELGADHGIDVEVYKFEGEGDYRKRLATTVASELEEVGTICVIGLVDLYGFAIDYPDDGSTVVQRIAHARRRMTASIDKGKRPFFRQHFAVHELEAWLLADRAIWPECIRNRIPEEPPEQINFDEPPAKLLKRLHVEELGRGYGKVRNAARRFQQLNPQLVAEKCPHFRAMVEDMKALALAAFGEEQ